MRSQYADRFNHDPEAAAYDQDVANEQDPVRTGYQAVLEWVIRSAQISPTASVLDLGTGTGNLARLIPICGELDCVDISGQMLDRARPKLSHLPTVRYHQTDLLQVFDQVDRAYDAVISTYAIHHLTDPEKTILFERIWERLKSGGRAVFGDLMLAAAGIREQQAAEYRTAGHPEVAEGILEEFYWPLDTAQERLRGLGFQVEMRSFSDLSWGIWAAKP